MIWFFIGGFLFFTLLYMLGIDSSLEERTLSILGSLMYFSIIVLFLYLLLLSAEHFSPTYELWFAE